MAKKNRARNFLARFFIFQRVGDRVGARVIDLVGVAVLASGSAVDVRATGAAVIAGAGFAVIESGIARGGRGAVNKFAASHNVNTINTPTTARPPQPNLGWGFGFAISLPGGLAPLPCDSCFAIRAIIADARRGRKLLPRRCRRRDGGVLPEIGNDLRQRRRGGKK